ncbi:MAG: UDP-2,3-diacylglucosamine diphosphatase [Rhodobacteraceae bacterium]|nr:UDP-2,3-diacylglucosamine diphosphatase [Paracoccaceae bacterium]
MQRKTGTAAGTAANRIDTGGRRTPSPGDSRPIRRRLRSLFVSDLHLGTLGAQARPFLDFLSETECETIYLVGDIFDIWHGAFLSWSPVHDAIIAELDARAAAGTRIVYLPGNHDAAMRNVVGIGAGAAMGGRFEVQDMLTHVAADGRRYLVLHGDQCDARVLRWHAMTRIGSRLDAGLRHFEGWLSRMLRPAAGGWGGLDLLRQGLAQLLLVGNRFEQRLVALARDSGHDGVICGHFHRAALRDHGAITYGNCGDWVDSLTALAEMPDGRLTVLEWAADIAPLADCNRNPGLGAMA